MLLSVIVPVFNVRPFLDRCLGSLIDQDLDVGDYEIIVINDGSDDGSLEVARRWAEQNTNIVVLSQENQGLSAARNAGMKRAKCDFVMFVDSDDYIASTVLGTLLDLARRQRLQVLAFDWKSTSDSTPSHEPFERPNQVEALPVTTGMDYMASHSYTNQVWAYVFERQYLQERGFAFEVGSLLEDVVYTALVLSAADRVSRAPIDVYRYVLRPGSIMKTWSKEHSRKLLADHVRVVFDLEKLRQDHLSSGDASEQYLDRLVNREQTFIFFMIARLIRTELPLEPQLTQALNRFALIGMYPMDNFPGRDYHGVQYRALAFVFNHRVLLIPFSRFVRWSISLRRRLHARRPVHR